MQEEVLYNVKNGVGVITLNRPDRLNALTFNMVKSISQNLVDWEKDDKIKTVIIEGAGEKAFCAGGDVVNLRKKVLEEGGPPTELSRNFFYEEYLLNYKINQFRKPFVALIDGVTMGGGVGVSMHGSHVVSTEKTMFAMPETAIGLFPDVGGGWLLAQLNSGLGLWLALTGDRLRAYDLLRTGLVNFYINSNKMGNLKEALIEVSSDNKEDVTNLINSYSSKPEKISVIENNEEVIKQIFEHDTIEKIFEELELLINEGNDFAVHTKKELLVKSPTSLKITLKQITQARQMSLAEDLVMEYRMVQKCQSSGDFYEGVRAMLVDKDRKPKWNPNSIDKVDEIWVNHFFEPLNENDLKIKT